MSLNNHLNMRLNKKSEYEAEVFNNNRSGVGQSGQSNPASISNMWKPANAGTFTIKRIASAATTNKRVTEKS